MLLTSIIEHGIVVSGRCSVCGRLFEVELIEGDILASVAMELNALFENHACHEGDDTALFET